MAYSLLKEVITHLEEYEANLTSNRIEDFIVWLNNRLFSKSETDTHGAHDELLIAFKVMFLNKDLKKQTKQVLSNTLVSSIDEYSFLLHLEHQESFRKMEIIEMHNLEAPTGIEIIKRLLKKGLIEEFPDPDDGRAKRIKVTHKGCHEIKSLKPEIDKIFTSFTNPLSLNEKIKLSGLMDKLIHQ